MIKLYYFYIFSIINYIIIFEIINIFFDLILNFNLKLFDILNLVIYKKYLLITIKKN